MFATRPDEFYTAVQPIKDFAKLSRGIINMRKFCDLNNYHFSRMLFLMGIAASAFLNGCGSENISEPAIPFEEQLQEKLISATSGEVITIPEGVHNISRSLSLNVSGVTIKGEGMEKSILSYKNQVQGAEGLLVNADNFVIEDLAIEDTTGDAIKINNSENVTIRRVRTEWTGGPLTTNGAYGIYPLQSRNILIDGAVAIGASDAGIYVGQSTNIIVRNSRAEYNVAGIEIENSTFADVYNNIATNNTGGILIFDLPNLPVQGGRNTRVFKNKVYTNNVENFAPEGNIVGSVPAGTGIMVLANDSIEVFENELSQNQTANILVVSYLINNIPINDPLFDPYPEAIYIHANTFIGGGMEPDSVPLASLKQATGEPVPDIVWDGDKATTEDGQALLDPFEILCISNNSSENFVNLDAGNNFQTPSFDISPHQCELPALSKVEFASAD